MADEHDSITQLSPQQKRFIVKQMDLVPGLFGRHRVQVQTGNKWLVYCDGLLVEQFGPGPHSWSNGFFHKWKAQIINTRTELLTTEASGRVKGPTFSGDAAGTALDLACEVKMELRISVKIVDIDNFIQYRDPLSIFYASLENMVVEFIGQLRYDQYAAWATELRDNVRMALQGGKYDSESRVGLRVEDVFATDPQPNTAHDRSMLAMYQLVERGRRELVEAKASAQRDNVAANSYADQGRILNLAPSILALQNSPIGQALIERDGSLREALIASGLNPGVNVRPLQEDPALISRDVPPQMAYLNPAPPTAQNTPGSAYPNPQEVTGHLANSGELLTPFPSQNSGSFASPFPSPDSQPAVIDETLREREIAALENAGFLTGGKGSIGPASYEHGQPMSASKEWTLQVYRRHTDGMLSMVFHCLMDYPTSPPGVQVKSPAGGGWTWSNPNTIHTWHARRSLAEVAQEIFESML
ncbi:MAG: hypothetical protein ACRDHW_08560 [Ktedonobacteraceae bacterium]